MKKYAIVFFILFIFFKINLYAQCIPFAPGSGGLLSKDTVAELKSFSAQHNSGSVYLKWVVANQHCDGIYIVYRSAGGLEYELIGKKQGIGVPVSNDIAYYFKDTSPLMGMATYIIL